MKPFIFIIQLKKTKPKAFMHHQCCCIGLYAVFCFLNEETIVSKQCELVEEFIVKSQRNNCGKLSIFLWLQVRVSSHQTTLIAIKNLSKLCLKLLILKKISAFISLLAFICMYKKNILGKKLTKETCIHFDTKVKTINKSI